MIVRSAGPDDAEAIWGVLEPTIRAGETYVVFGRSTDCNSNRIPDECDLAACQPGEPSCDDCNENNRPDACDIRGGADGDCNENQIPDTCELPQSGSIDTSWISELPGLPPTVPMANTLEGVQEFVTTHLFIET